MRIICEYCNEQDHRINRCRHPSAIFKIEEIKSACNLIYNIGQFKHISNQNIKCLIIYYLSGNLLKVKYVNGVEETFPSVEIKDVIIVSYSLKINITHTESEFIDKVANKLFDTCDRVFSYPLIIESYTLRYITVTVNDIFPILTSPFVMNKQTNMFELIEYECSICYENYKNNSNKVFTNCNHEYCKSCFDRLINQSKHGLLPCPMCRTNVTEITTTII